MENILLKPINTEKSNFLTDKNTVYTFQVNKKANKIQVKNAVEKMFNVEVEKVRTMIMPKLNKVRNTKNGATRGTIPSYKKALVQLKFGQSLDFYNID